MEVKPGYKKTEVGVIPNEWELRGLLTTVRIANGQVDPRNQPFRSMTLVAPDHIETGTGKLLEKRTAAEQRAISGKYRFATGDIVYSKIRPYLRKAILAEFDGLCSADMYPLKPAEDVDGGFIFAVLLAHRFTKYAESVSVRSGMPKINRAEMADFILALPPRPEQRAIAKALSDVDGLLAGLDRLIAKKRDLKQAVMQQLLTGQTRLPGFHGDWGVKAFSDVLTKINAKAYQVQTLEYQASGTFPVIDQGQAMIIGFSDREDKRFKCPDGGVAIFGDHTCIVKFVDFDFVVGADGTQILAAKNGHCARFHAFHLQARGISPTGYNRHFKFLKEREFVCPLLPEQTAIAEVLTDMDAEVFALEERWEKTHALKQAMMQELLTGKVRLI